MPNSAIKIVEEQSLKEAMILDSIIILATVEFIQRRIEQKLLDIDALGEDYTFGDMAEIRTQVLELLSKLRREEKRMDEFMDKYRRLVNEAKVLLSHSREKKPIYLRGVSTHVRRSEKSKAA